MAIDVKGGTSGIIADVDSASKALRSVLYDQNGNPIARVNGGAAIATDRFLPVGGLNDGNFRALRTDRFGGMASSRFSLLAAYQLTAAATLPPAWLSTLTGAFTTTHAQVSGTLLNAGATGAATNAAALNSIAAFSRYQKAPMQMRTRARLVKGGTNGQADIGLSSAQAPGTSVVPNGFIWQYAADNTLRPMVMQASASVVTGTDIASLINSANYYIWDIVVDDDAVIFTVQDGTTGATVNEQTLRINAGDARFAMSQSWYGHVRSWVGGSANVGAATQIYVADITIGMLDVDTNKPWSHTMAGLMQGGTVNPNSGLAQITNYAVSTGPTSATLAVGTPSYATLGGQWQFVALAGAETDYCLFSYTVPAGFNFNCTDIQIDAFNVGAANSATVPTVLSWMIAGDSLAATLASNTYRMALGSQVIPINGAIGAPATQITRSFGTPITTHSGRFFIIGLKVPFGAATASQIIRGTVGVGGYFD